MIITEKKYAAIVIAAGLSSRMDGFKPLLDIGGRPALFRLLDSILDAGIRNIIIVTGHRHDLLEEAVVRFKSADNLFIAHNAEYESGMFSSVKTGIRFTMDLELSLYDGDLRAALLFPVDVPLVSAETVFDLVRFWERFSSPYSEAQSFSDVDALDRATEPFAIPVHEGRNGHPLLIPRAYFNEILDFSGEGGLKGVRSRHDAEMIRYEVNDPGCVLDMDTPQEYAELKEYYERRKQKT